MIARIGAATWQAIDVALQTYADALDRADLGALLSVFAEDAVWEYRPDAPLRGRAAIERSFAGIGVFAQTSHHVGPPVVSPGPRAGTYESVAYFIATHILAAGGTYTVFGRYCDLWDGDPPLLARRRVVAHVVDGTDKQYHRLERAVQ